MSSVLSILTAFDFELKLSFSKGKRKDTEKIRGESIPVIENINSVRVDFVMNAVDSLISRYLYYSAKLLLEDLLRKGLTGDLQRKLLRKTELCDAFYHWDNFEYPSFSTTTSLQCGHLISLFLIHTIPSPSTVISLAVFLSPPEQMK